MTELLGGGVGAVVILFLILLAFLWFLLPFAIFGTKDRLSALIAESQKTNVALAHTNAALARIEAELAFARAEFAEERAYRPATPEPNNPITPPPLRAAD